MKIEQDRQTTHIEVTDEQEIRLRAHLKLMEEVLQSGRDFYLSDYLDAINPPEGICKEGSFRLLSQTGNIQKYRCESCGADLSRRASVSEKDWKHYKPGYEPKD